MITWQDGSARGRQWMLSNSIENSKSQLLKALDTISPDIRIGKLRKSGSDEWTVGWVMNWLSGRAQRVVIIWRPVVSDIPQGLYWVQSYSACLSMTWMKG